MSLSKYSRKARERFADHLFSLATSLVTGFTTVLLIAPLGLALSALFRPGDETEGFFEALVTIPPLEGAMFVAIYLAVVWLSVSARTQAMKIYTELYPDRCASP